MTEVVESLELDKLMVAYSISGARSAVLAVYGQLLQSFVSECTDHLAELEIGGFTTCDPSQGIWVWEGTVVATGGEYDAFNGDYADIDLDFTKGKWRGLTIEEAERLVDGRHPWEK